jgi:hypothetical protein
MTKRFYLGLLAGMLLLLPGCGYEKSHSAPKEAAYSKPSPPRLAKNYIFGRIAAISGDQWKINGIHGNTYTAHVTTVTMYGDIFRPQHRNDFKVGDDVRIAGEFVGSAVAATAVEHGVDDD